MALTDLPACDPPPLADVEVEGVVLPDGAYVSAVDAGEVLTLANGWAPMPPVDVAAFYDRPPDGWVTLTTEHEVVEAEVLLDSGTHRMFVVATAACPTGSSLYLRVMASPEQ